MASIRRLVRLREALDVVIEARSMEARRRRILDTIERHVRRATSGRGRRSAEPRRGYYRAGREAARRLEALGGAPRGEKSFYRGLRWSLRMKKTPDRGSPYGR